MQVFTNDTYLSSGADCRHHFPSPPAILGLLPRPLKHAHQLLVDNFSGQEKVLPRKDFLGVGGNGVVVRHVLRMKEYALKLVSYCGVSLFLNRNLVYMCKYTTAVADFCMMCMNNDSD